MSTTFNLLDDAKIVELLTPATDAAGRTGAWINGKLARKAFIRCHLAQGNAATVQFSIQQATSSAGAGAKVITTNVRIASNLDTSVNDNLVARAAGVNYTTDAGVKNKQVVFEVDLLTVLDLANGFTWFTIVTGASNVANVTEAEAVLVGLRYHEAPPPSMVVA
jgi:hypothetical protein